MADVAHGGLERMRSSRDVSTVLNRGHRRATARLAMHVRPSDVPDRGRMAVVASRRVGNSPVRNRAKRLLREAAARIDWPEGHDVVLVARPGIVGASMWDVHGDLTELASRSSGGENWVAR